jgi:hypothetical protein
MARSAVDYNRRAAESESACQSQSIRAMVVLPQESWVIRPDYSRLGSLRHVDRDGPEERGTDEQLRRVGVHSQSIPSQGSFHDVQVALR